MDMTLSDIEAKADELAQRLLVVGKQEALLLGIQIEGLRDLAQIKAVGDQRAQWWSGPGNGKQEAEPTKPAADRLHELVSYGAQMEASNRTVEYPCPDAADAYQDMTSKLQDILTEGGI